MRSTSLTDVDVYGCKRQKVEWTMTYAYVREWDKLLAHLILTRNFIRIDVNIVYDVIYDGVATHQREVIRNYTILYMQSRRCYISYSIIFDSAKNSTLKIK